MSEPSAGPADSVRPARPAEAARVAALQAAAWREAYEGVLPPQVLAELAPERLEPVWREAAGRPPSARHRLLVALDGNDVAGFAAVAPADDVDLAPGGAGELLALVVDPARRGTGHGSRLLQAVADVLGGAGTGELVCWVGEREEPLAAFLRGAGWAQDGAWRVLDVAGDGSVPLRQHRWATRLADGGDGADGERPAAAPA